jgi:hypothetical protein
MFACGSKQLPVEMSSGPGPVAERTSIAGAMSATKSAMTQGYNRAVTQGGIASATGGMARGMGMNVPTSQQKQMTALAGPSRNERNNKMVLEVAQFSRQVQLLYTDVSTWSAGIDGEQGNARARIPGGRASPFTAPHPPTIA